MEPDAVWFQVSELANLLIEIIYRYRRDEKFLLHDFVIMTDHVHVILTPVGITLERAMQLIKGGYSFAVRQKGRSTSEVWQKRFTGHRIRDASDLTQHRIYIHQNPVRRRLCERSEEYA